MTKLLLFDFFGVIAFSSSPLSLNQELLDFIEKQKQKYKTAILSSSGPLLKNKLVSSKINKYFDIIYSSGDFNLSKSDPEIYKLVAEKFNIKPEEIFFIDDFPERVSAAKAAGCQAILFEDNQKLFDSISKLI